MHVFIYLYNVTIDLKSITFKGNNIYSRYSSGRCTLCSVHIYIYIYIYITDTIHIHTHIYTYPPTHIQTLVSFS